MDYSVVLKKIVIIGPESTGKSTLCRQLAEHFKTDWVPEYAREYLLKNGTDYTYDDLLMIAKGQLALEDDYTKRAMGNGQLAISNEQWATGKSKFSALNSPLFIDTDMYVMKVWCEFVFGKCHDFILKEIAKRKYDLYLLCNTDLPWVKDELREYPDVETREKLFLIYKDILINQNTPWVEISGDYAKRLETATEAVEGLL